jgi:hypothetical protein
MSIFPISPSRARAAVCVSLLCATGAVAAADVPAASKSAQNSNAVADTAVAESAAATLAPVVALHSGDAAEFAPDSSKVTMQRRADGTRVYLMNGQGMETMSAHIGADGKLELRCSDEAVDNARSAAAAEHVDER